MTSLYEIAGMYRTIIEMEPETDDEFGAMMTALDELRCLSLRARLRGRNVGKGVES